MHYCVYRFSKKDYFSILGINCFVKDRRSSKSFLNKENAIRHFRKLGYREKIFYFTDELHKKLEAKLSNLL